MLETESNERIRDLFEAAHAADRPPAFDRLWTRAGRRQRRLLHLVPVATALLLVLAFGWLVVSSIGQGEIELSEADAQALAESLSTWRGPTDFLLDTPGSEYFFSIPVLEVRVPGNGAYGTQQEVLQ